jgi:hypothetical protein
MTRRGRAGERGQATVEWIGLVLGLALALGGALGVARGADFGGEAHGLGEALASQVTCAARDACAAERGGAPGGRAVRSPPSWRRPAPALGAFGGRGIRPSAPWERAPRGLRGVEGARAGVLRALGELGRHAWFGCLGYRRVRYDLAHPRTSREGTPPGETLDALNECLNPWEFLFP